MSVNSGSMLRSATSDDETSTEKDPNNSVVLIDKLRHPALLWIVFVFFLLVVWGVSLLQAVFFLITYKEEDKPNISNQTHLPQYPCNKPLKMNHANNRCALPCEWVSFTKSQDTAQTIVDNISLTISLLGFLFILLTWISIKRLRVFPHIIPLYIQGTSSCISLLIVISNAMGRKESFCSHEFFTEASKSPTNFCVAQGLLIQYFSNVTAMWFIVYSICLLQMICSNNSFHRNRSTRIPHLISAACCCLLPWILVGIVFKEGGYGTVLNMRLCLPKSENLTYYTNAMITEIGQAVACSCLLFVVFKLYSIRNLELLQGDQAKRRKSRLDKVAIRLVCLMFAYAVITALVYIPMCIQQRNKPYLKKYLKEYFGCLLFAPSSAHCSKEKYQSVAYANTFIISYLSSALFTISTISFLAFNKQSRRLWFFWWQRLVDCCCLPEETNSADL
ncbi:uncharacterized protein LOC116305309 [Actinia tenebrosa]|uniref:Uncharacterized protein LOC116305309 n=1 Tax=Actinia tenebrosa TaxID=6105 RepID=A0A6P8IVN8_ACTTE|nr:uncharacterized protein LOC116305309 [Actinia tenebrosa]